MEEKQVAMKIGSDATTSTDKCPPDDLVKEGKGNPRVCSDSKDVKSWSGVSDNNFREEESVDNVDDGAPAAMLSTEEEVQWQITNGLSIPGAHHIEGPRLAGSSRGNITNLMESFGTSVDGMDISALDAELVVQEEGSATLRRSEPFKPSMSDLVDVMTLPDKSSSQERKGVNSKVLCLVSFLVLSAAAIFLAIFLVPNVHHAESTTSPSSSSSGGNQPQGLNASVHPPFHDALPQAVLHDIGDPTSPFYSANLWMLGDPNLDSYSPERQRQRFYLAMLYHATKGDHWFHRDHWMSYNISECQWYSHSSLPTDSPYYISNVCNDNETITSLSLAQNNLTGTLPLFPTLLLPQLRALDLNDNNIGGAVPPVFSGPNLEVLIISDNDFTGSWKTGDGVFDFKIKVLKTNGNCMTAGFPNNQDIFMFKLKDTIEVGNATGNCFAGSVPTEVGLLTKLRYVGRGDNNLFGTLPSELGLLTFLQHMDFGGNFLMNGTIPAELEDLAALTHLDIAGTAMSGSIPLRLCEKVKQGTLVIEANCSSLYCCA